MLPADAVGNVFVRLMSQRSRLPPPSDGPDCSQASQAFLRRVYARGRKEKKKRKERMKGGGGGGC